MATQKQIEANIRNSKKSTGPKTERGINNAKRNAIKHGLYAGDIIIQGGCLKENPDDILELMQRLRSDLKPVGYLENHLVTRLGEIAWQYLRFRKFENDEFKNAEFDYENEITFHSEAEFRKQQELLVGDLWPRSVDFSPSSIDELHRFLTKLIEKAETKEGISDQEGTRLYNLFGLSQSGRGSRESFLREINVSFLKTQRLQMKGLMDVYENIRAAERTKNPGPSIFPSAEGTDRFIRHLGFLDNRFSRSLREFVALQDRRRAEKNDAPKAVGGSSK